MWLQLGLLRRRRTSSIVAASAVVFGIVGRAKADDLTKRVTTSVSGYQDDVSVSVLTPALSFSIDNSVAGWGVRGSYLVDVVSAASPDIVSTASPRWTEVRNAGSVGFNFKPKTTGFALNASGSSTPDYLAISGGGQLLQELDEKNWSLSAGYSFGKDIAGRTGTPFSVFSNVFYTHAPSLNVSRVLSKNSLLSVSADAFIERGDQSKPYRYVPLFFPTVAPTVGAGATAEQVANLRLPSRPAEQLPRERDRLSVTVRFLTRPGSTTFRFEERAYADSWNLRASTSDLRILVDTSKRVTLWPHLHAHVQSGVDFWKRAYTSTGVNDLPTFRTGDRELGPLATAGLGGGFRVALGPPSELDAWVLSTSLEGFATFFFDALYIKRRISGVSSVTLEAKF